MGKAIGLFACTAVAAAALWLTNARQPASTASAQEEFDPRSGAPTRGSGPRVSASELLQRGTALYLEGRHAEAAQTLEAARAHQQQLTGPQARRLAEYLQLARNELRRAAEPAVQSDGASPALGGEAARARVTEYMRRAHLEHQAGNSLQAVRWAATADSVARSAAIDFPPGQETPHEFIVRVREAAPPAAPAHASELNVAALDGGPDSAYPLSPEAREARRLMQEARAALNAGRHEDARLLAKQASELEASWRLFDETPEQLLADIERSTGLIRFPRGEAPQAVAARGATLPSIHPSSQGGAGAAGVEIQRDQAVELLRQARQDMAEGQLDSAQAKAVAAGGMNVAYQVFDDRPEIVLQDIERLSRSRSSIARRDGLPAIEPGPAGFSGAPISAQDSPEKQHARSLLGQARRALREGRFDEARQLVAEAERIPVAYGTFEDTPQHVAEMIDQLTRPPQAAGSSIASGEQPVRPIPAAPHGDGFDRDAPPFDAQPEHVQPVVGSHDPRWQTPTQPIDYRPADLDVVRPSGPSATELFNEGLAQLRQGQRDLAYESFLAAHRSGQQLDPHRAQQLQDFLRDLRPRQNALRQFADAAQPGAAVPAGASSDGPGGLFAVEQQRAIQYDRLRTETLNAIFKADRLREKDPQQALEIVDRATASIGSSEFDPETVAPLLSQLRRTRQSIETWQNQRAPIIALEQQNAEVYEEVRRQREVEIRVEQDVAALVDKFNELFNQRRYAEAEVIAKQARDLDSDNPVTEVLFWKARYARRVDSNKQLIEDKDEAIWTMLDQVETAAVPETRDFSFSKDWPDINNRRKGRYGPDTRIRTEQEQQIEQSLSRRISLNFEKAPLSEVLKHVAAIADINVALDKQGLEEEGVPTDQEVTIHVEGIMLKSALNLMLKPLHLGYTIEDEVLKITSRMRQQGQLQVRNYTVADLVMPIPNFTPSSAAGMTSSGTGHNAYGFNTMSGGARGVPQPGGAQFQVQDPAIPGAPVYNALSGAGRDAGVGGGMSIDFDTIMELIVSTIEPDTWAEMGGPGSIRPFETTLSLVIRQSGAVHDEIADLLQQLRRLQDLQVVIEVRFISVNDRFFESIGVDFDFEVQDNVEADDAFPLPAFGTAGGPGVTGSPVAGQQAQQGQQQQQSSGFNPIPGLFLQDLDDWPKTGTVVGQSAPGEFTPDLDIAFRQGSFDVGVPEFGDFNPDAGLQVGMAILSDIEAFFFIRAAQGDSRTNIMFAPKVTLFNGQQATVTDAVQRPFVTSLVPTVGFGAVGFTPQITVLQEGVSMTVLAVISADRRFVRLTVIPFFSSITDVFTFTFQQGAGQGGAGVQGQGQGGQLGQGGQGGFNPIGGFGGIGGGEMARNALMLALPAQQQVVVEAPTVTIQQPVLEFVTVTTTVSVPDGGTVLLGGVKRLREGRNMAGVPILNKLPYLSRLFKNTGVGRDTESLMLMVTPRIIIQEEEEELLGIPIQ
ncbi:MAG TPA: hypothetical protein VML55_13215 [Planctomycetaceae bacterium]|nr:hypothetical protein [Planctomycetaceae bacterium]